MVYLVTVIVIFSFIFPQQVIFQTNYDHMQVVLQWSLTFCQMPENDCRSSVNKLKFIVHGLKSKGTQNGEIRSKNYSAKVGNLGALRRKCKLGGQRKSGRWKTQQYCLRCDSVNKIRKKNSVAAPSIGCSVAFPNLRQTLAQYIYSYFNLLSQEPNQKIKIP